jgi:hypothetical protein
MDSMNLRVVFYIMGELHGLGTQLDSLFHILREKKKFKKRVKNPLRKNDFISKGKAYFEGQRGIPQLCILSVIIQISLQTNALDQLGRKSCVWRGKVKKHINPLSPLSQRTTPSTGVWQVV